MELTVVKTNIDYLKTTVDRLEKKIDNLISVVAELKNEIRGTGSKTDMQDFNKSLEQITEQFSRLSTTPKEKSTTKNFLIYNVEDYKKKLNKK